MALTVLQEIGSALHWASDRVVGMLWAYFDESGTHNKDGSYKRLSVAGCIAPYEAWQAFETEWRIILQIHNIESFHMNEFEPKRQGRKSPYHGWSVGKKKLFLELLLTIMGRHINLYMGFQELAKPGQKRARQLYIPNIPVITHWLAEIARTEQDKISFVFAKHPEISNEEIGRFCDSIKAQLPSIELAMMGNPVSMPPLQASDIFAYEYSHCSQWDNPFKWRDPLKMLRQTAARFIVWPEPQDRDGGIPLPESMGSLEKRIKE